MFKKIFLSTLILSLVFVYYENRIVKAEVSGSQQNPPQTTAHEQNTQANQGDKEDAKTSSDPKQEISDLKDKILDIQNKADLGFWKVVPCKGVESYGIYSLLEAGQPASKVIFYVEPANYGVLKSDGRYIIDCSVDLLIFDPSGKLIVGNENVRKINKVSRSPILDLYFTVELNIAKTVKQKSFIVKMVINDRIKNKSASTSHRVHLGPVSKKNGDSI